MTNSSRDFEAIVREVLKRLAAMDHVGGTGGLPTSVICEKCSGHGRDGRGTVGNEGQPATITLEVTERLVTLATLEGKLAGVRQVRVAARAVVTPAVRDALKERKIELVRS